MFYHRWKDDLDVSKLYHDYPDLALEYVAQLHIQTCKFVQQKCMLSTRISSTGDPRFVTLCSLLCRQPWVWLRPRSSHPLEKISTSQRPPAAAERICCSQQLGLQLFVEPSGEVKCEPLDFGCSISGQFPQVEVCNTSKICSLPLAYVVSVELMLPVLQ